MDDILKKHVIEIWEEHISTNQFVLDGNGNAVNNIDDSRLEAIKVIKVIIKDFISDEITLPEFKAALDVFNRHNNLWNFSAKMGQMYFNLLLKANEDNMPKLTELLKNVISEPKDLKDALKKIEELEKFTNSIFLTAEDKRKVPYPGSVGYFLSYFWQVHNHDKWPILYSSLINGFREIGIWKDQTTQKSAYNFFYELNEELKSILRESSKHEISNWDIEHTFWNFKFSKNPYQITNGEETATVKTGKTETETSISQSNEKAYKVTETASYVNDSTARSRGALSFEINDYLIPKVNRLFELKGGADGMDQFEPLVAETFRQLEFEVEILPQGPRKNPYAIIKFREENTAFMVDVKANSELYFSITDDRALKESIRDNSIDLKKAGYKKIGFILVCNSFESGHDAFINYICWNTEIKKMFLITSDALLYMLAYKAKEKLKLEAVIENMANFGNVVTPENIIGIFEKSTH